MTCTQVALDSTGTLDIYEPHEAFLPRRQPRTGRRNMPTIAGSVRPSASSSS